jgi:hypothetical protein
MPIALMMFIYKGIPTIILKGNVNANAIETYKLGFASGILAIALTWQGYSLY